VNVFFIYNTIIIIHIVFHCHHLLSLCSGKRPYLSDLSVSVTRTVVQGKAHKCVREPI
jgi:hypothetical protein